MTSSFVWNHLPAPEGLTVGPGGGRVELGDVLFVLTPGESVGLLPAASGLICPTERGRGDGRCSPGRPAHGGTSGSARPHASSKDL